MSMKFDSDYRREAYPNPAFSGINDPLSSVLVGTDVPMKLRDYQKRQCEKLAVGSSCSVIIRRHPKHGEEKTIVYRIA